MKRGAAGEIMVFQKGRTDRAAYSFRRPAGDSVW